MNHINAFKKIFLNLLIPYIESNNKKTDSYQAQKFRELLKERKAFIFIVALIFFLIAFGVGKTFSYIALVIAVSPFMVIFWSSFGEKIIGLFKLNNK